MIVTIIVGQGHSQPKDESATSHLPSFLEPLGFEEKVGRRLPRPWSKLATVVADQVAIFAALMVAFWLQAVLPGRDPTAAFSHRAVIALASLPVWSAMFWRNRLYSGTRTRSRPEEFRRLVDATLTSVVTLAALGYVLRVNVARGWFVSSGVLVVLVVAVERGLARRVLAGMRGRGRLLERVLVVGGNIEGMALCAMLVNSPRLGYDVVGVVDDDLEPGTSVVERPVLGRVDDTLEIARHHGAVGVIVATTSVDLESSNLLIRRLTEAGLHVALSSSLRDISSARLFVGPLGRFPVVHIEPGRRNGWQVGAKRLFDIAFAFVASLLTLPLMAIVAIAVKLDSRGPVFFRQKRVGQLGRPFEVFKFRTMVSNAEQLVGSLRDRNEADGPLFKMRVDPRCTHLGRLLRALSIDELPQLWNVLRGEMSLVGPRPALPTEVEMWTPTLHQRLSVKPGITGMWQVNGRSSASFEDYVRLDLYYVDNWSLWTDVAILAKTIPVVLLRRGAH